MGFPENGEMTEDEQKLSDVMKAMYPEYLNSLGLKDPETGEDLTLEEDGTGSYYDYIKSFVIASANRALEEKLENGFTLENGRVTDVDLPKYAACDGYGRMKPSGSFDNGFLCWTGENNQFTLGSVKESNTHFDPDLAAAVEKANEEGAKIEGLDGQDFSVNADQEILDMMNPMTFVDGSKSDVAPYFYIRVGAQDADHAYCISANLYTSLVNHKAVKDASYAIQWGRPHTGEYSMPEMFDWLDQFCK